MKTNYWPLLILLLMYFIINLFDQLYVFTDEFIYRSLRNEFSESALEALITSHNRFGWISFALLPFIILLKILFTAFCVTTGAIFTDTDFSFGNIFQSATYSEFIFLFSQAVFSLNLFLNRDELTIDSAGNFFPLSVLSYFGVENVVIWLHYPLQTLNVFEVAYVLCLTWLLSRQWKPDFVDSINIVLPSYGIGLLTWMMLVVFLTLQIS
ncbi:hypothetical protein QA596_05405 [Balneolales bacterium ANBcel1]|nr:hypothetical protein [Balneolales bacterium ANBcel1]